MKYLFGRITLPPLLTAAILLACGPATHSEPQTQPTAQTVAQDSDPEPTSTPTPIATATPEPPTYPNLDTFLRDPETKYKAGELTEAAEPQMQPTSQAASQDSDPDPTPTPTPTAEPPKYPNLDAFLRDLVAKYEAEELSEVAAAARTPVYHGSSVLVVQLF